MIKNNNSKIDIKNYNIEDLKKLSAELREEILTTVSQNGGHLASNLGMVETTIALHRVFDLPEDKIIFDVGHQCYTHKMLSGRRDMLYSLRKFKGLSGFTNRDESVYDTLNAGHCGTSVSAALGIAVANSLNNNSNYVIAVVGDGALTNGMIYEAFNNCTNKDLRLIILLNDNEMSISLNVGGLSKYLSSIRTSSRYFSFKHNLQLIFNKIPFVGNGLISLTRAIKNLIKRVLIKNNFFESLGLIYLGPVDGHDVKKLEIVLNEAKTRNKCCLVHIKTKKGKGYKYAEEHPELYHSVGSFDLAKGVIQSKQKSFSSKFGEIMCNKAKKDLKLCAVTSAMCEGTGLLEFSKQYPERFFDVGIAEEHSVTFCGGLAVNGMKPVCALYSTFSQRVYDQISHDISIQKLPFILALDRCGLVPGDGITHQGIFDCSFLSSIPNMEIYSPETYEEMQETFDTAFGGSSIVAIRYPKGEEIKYDRQNFIKVENFCYLSEGGSDFDITIITYGRITAEAYYAVKKLSKKYNVRLIKLIKIYPLNFDEIFNFCKNSKLIYILEEGILSGGIAEKIAAGYALYNTESRAKVYIKAIENKFVEHGDISSLYHLCGFNHEQITDEIENCLKEL